MKYRISVIVPIYNVEKYLNECVQSIVAQTYKNLEIILVDDGSQDRCPEICDSWAGRDSRVRVIHQNNGGLSAARNAGLDIAKGDYIAFVDSDDYIAADMFQVMLEALETSTTKIACCSPYIVTEQGELIREGRYPSERLLDIQQALHEVFTMRAEVSVWSKLYDRAIFEDLRFPVGETNEDFPILIPTIVSANGMVHVQRCLYYYRQRGGSITSQLLPNEENSHLVYKNLQIMEKQLHSINLRKDLGFRFFSAQYAYWFALKCEKKYGLLSDKLKADYELYRTILRRYCLHYLISRNSLFKDKILYILVLTRLLRPVYRFIRPERL